MQKSKSSKFVVISLLLMLLFQTTISDVKAFTPNWQYTTAEYGSFDSKITFKFGSKGVIDFVTNVKEVEICISDVCSTYISTILPHKGSIDISNKTDGTYSIVFYNIFFYNQTDFEVISGTAYYLPNDMVKKNWNFMYDLSTRDPQYYTTTSQISNSMTLAQYNEIKNKVQQIIYGKVTNYDKALAIYEWVTNNFYYDYDCFEDRTCTNNSLYETFKLQRGVCTHFSDITSAMMRIAGIPALTMNGIAYTSYGAGGHAWNAIYVNHRWMILDSTWDTSNAYSDGEYYPWGVSLNYFDVGIESISYDHEITRLPYYPIAMENRVESIQIAKLPSRLSYVKGENVDLSGAKITGVTFGGSYIDLPLSSMSVSGFDSYLPTFGKQQVDLKYLTLSQTFDVYLVRYKDVPYDYAFYTRIMDLSEKNIINGYSDQTFRPLNNLTRAQAAIIIVRALGLEFKGKVSDFSDVPSSHSAYEYISAAYEAGIINGYSIDNTFRPNLFVTRQQIAVMIQRAFNVVHSGKTTAFTDVTDNMQTKVFIETLASQGIINGYQDGTFKPFNNATRAQFSSMIYNALRYKALD
jgi:transglutaminase-like putative cysteine protease